MKKYLLLIALLLPLTMTFGAIKTEFNWTAPLTNEDGTPLIDLVGFKFYCGTNSGAYTTSSVIPDAAATSVLIADIVPEDGQAYYCAAVAYNTYNIESVYSNEVYIGTLINGAIDIKVPVAPFALGIQ